MIIIPIFKKKRLSYIFSHATSQREKQILLSQIHPHKCVTQMSCLVHKEASGLQQLPRQVFLQELQSPRGGGWPMGDTITKLLSEISNQDF